MILTFEGLERLQLIGGQLDRQIYPLVKRGGIVMPDQSAASSLIGQERTSGSEASRPEAAPGTPERARSRPEASRGRSGTARQAASIVGGDLPEPHRASIENLNAAYPGVQVWVRGDGIWVLTTAALLPELTTGAVFLTGIASLLPVARSWAFWGSSALPAGWIGPRHTNHPDGSVCAFDPADGTWSVGEPLVDLMDLYSVWAVRHLYLRVFGRWPGEQSVPFPFERRWELGEDETCGCGKSHLRYGECCRDSDLRQNPVASAIRYQLLFGARRPPAAVWPFLCERNQPPGIREYVIAPTLGGLW